MNSSALHVQQRGREKIHMLNDQTFLSIVEKLKTAKDKDGNFLNMDSIVASTSESHFEHEFKDTTAFNDLRSVSKPVLCLGLGIAIEEGLRVGGEKLTLETRIWPLFESVITLVNKKNLGKLRQLKLKHLLNNTIGHETGILFRKDIGDRDETTLLDYAFNEDLKYSPGSHFVYSNAGPYIVSAMIQNELGITVQDMINRSLFSKLDIGKSSWRKLGNYTAGCTGLHLFNRDLHKIARLLADGGGHGGRQIVPGHWIRKMKEEFVKTPQMYDERRAFPKFGYGHYLWKCRDGSVYCDGTDGQYLILLGDGDTVITTLGHQPDMKPITECFRELLQ